MKKILGLLVSMMMLILPLISYAASPNQNLTGPVGRNIAITWF
jgi:hypothetical protein